MKPKEIRALNCINRYYKKNAEWPNNSWISREIKTNITGTKTILRTLAEAGAVELNERVEVIGSASVRISWMSRPLVRAA